MWSYTYTGQTKREEDPYIRRVDFLGDIGADIRDRTTGSRRVLKKTERAPPATSKKEQQPQKNAATADPKPSSRYKFLLPLDFLSLNAHFFFAVALAGDFPITRRRQLQEVDLGDGTQMDFGTGYASSSAGQKERRRDAQVMRNAGEDCTACQSRRRQGVNDRTAAQHTQGHHNGSAGGDGTAGTCTAFAFLYFTHLLLITISPIHSVLCSQLGCLAVLLSSCCNPLSRAPPGGHG
jgi:hypothetical protein